MQHRYVLQVHGVNFAHKASNGDVPIRSSYRAQTRDSRDTRTGRRVEGVIATLPPLESFCPGNQLGSGAAGRAAAGRILGHRIPRLRPSQYQVVLCLPCALRESLEVAVGNLKTALERGRGRKEWE